MSTTTTRNRGDHYGPMEWAQWLWRHWMQKGIEHLYGNRCLMRLRATFVSAASVWHCPANGLWRRLSEILRWYIISFFSCFFSQFIRGGESDVITACAARIYRFCLVCVCVCPVLVPKSDNFITTSHFAFTLLWRISPIWPTPCRRQGLMNHRNIVDFGVM